MATIDHIVVLMMENRSFDNMLGSLSLARARGGAGRTDVNGLKGDESNQYDGKDYPIFPLTSTQFHDEPCHDFACVQRQLKHDNGGFVFDFEGVRRGEATGAVMGYIPSGSLPVYDFLVNEFVLCDRWHCSVPGPTWPNRLYSIAGQSDGQHDNHMPHIGFTIKTIFEHLSEAGASWGYYAHDRLFSFLRVFQHFMAGNDIRAFDRFYAEATAGTLPSVVWLEPEFGTRPGSVANDDHPPSDVLRGQELVRRIYDALRGGPLWEKTLFILTYDEHGGFFDHVIPPAADDDRTDFRQYGLRVPSFIISPFVARGAVVDDIFDHTSILRMVLDRFCTKADGTTPSMGERTKHAKSVMDLVTLVAPRATPPNAPPVPAPGPTPPSPVLASGASVPTSSRDALMLAVGGAALAAGVQDVA